MAPPQKHRIRWARRFFPLLAAQALGLSVAVPPVFGDVATDGSLGPAQVLSGPDFAITEQLGTIRGSNLFHSFSHFSLATGESATFSGSSTVENIISRVTGGSASNIDGLIRSTIDGANLYLMNPSGVLFGPNASLDVRGSFHVSTADYLRLGGEGIFYADLGKDSVLAVAPVSAFGFLADNPAGVSLVKGPTQGSLVVPAGQTLSLVGGDIEIRGNVAAGGIALQASGGRINLVSVASGGEAVPNCSVIAKSGPDSAWAEPRLPSVMTSP